MSSAGGKRWLPPAAHVISVRADTTRTLLQRLPTQSTWSTLLGFSSSLNLGGRSCARCGTCRSPMHSTRTMAATGAAAAPGGRGAPLALPLRRAHARAWVRAAPGARRGWLRSLRHLLSS